MSVSDIEKELLEKTAKIQELLGQAQGLMNATYILAAEHGMSFDFALANKNNSEEFDDAQENIQGQVSELVESVGWNSSSLGC